MSEPTVAWPFLIGRGRRVGYRTLLAPGPLLANREQAALSRAVQRSASQEPSVTTIETLSLGRLTVVYRNRRITDGESADGVPAPVYDEHGRPLEVLYGFVLPAARLGEIHPDDLRGAEQSAAEAMAHFLADEDSAAAQAAVPFQLQTPTSPLIDETVTPSEPDLPTPAAPRQLRAPRPAALVTAGALLLVVVAFVMPRGPGADLEVVAGADACRELSASAPSCTVVVVSSAESVLDVQIDVQPETWSVEATCAASVQSGARCDVVVTAPSLAGGEVEGRLTVVHSGAGSPLEIPLVYSDAAE